MTENNRKKLKGVHFETDLPGVDVFVNCMKSLCKKISFGLKDEEIFQTKKERKTNFNKVVKSKIRVLIEQDPSHTLLSLKETLCNRGIVISNTTISRH